MDKKCCTCKETKPIEEFGFDRNKKDGHKSRCKKCKQHESREYYAGNKNNILRAGAEWRNKNKEKMKALKKAWYQKNAERARAWGKIYSNTKKGKEVRRSADAKQHENYPEKRKARSAINNAVYSGRLPKAANLKCEHCNNKARVYHHHKGYNPEHWLDVIPVCTSCHRKIHNP